MVSQLSWHSPMLLLASERSPRPARPPHVTVATATGRSKLPFAAFKVNSGLSAVTSVRRRVLPSCQQTTLGVGRSDRQHDFCHISVSRRIARRATEQCSTETTITRSFLGWNQFGTESRQQRVDDWSVTLSTRDGACTQQIIDGTRACGSVAASPRTSTSSERRWVSCSQGVSGGDQSRRTTVERVS